MAIDAIHYAINATTGLPDDYVPGFVCTVATCSVSEWGAIKYQPNIGGNVIFLLLIDFMGLAHLILGAYHETGFFALAMLFGLAAESCGYVARILLHSDPFSRAFFLWYLICLTTGPAFIAAAIYISLGRIVVVYGEGISRIKPRTYTYFFLGCDFIALTVQSVGGGMAAAAAVTDHTMINNGTHILVAGLSFQVASLFAFSLCAAEFLWRVHKHPELRNPDFADVQNSNKFKWYLRAIFFADIALFIRTVFRSVELSQGFGGSLANNQVEFMILDGVMVVSACLVLTAAHPFFIFGKRWRDTNFQFTNRVRVDREAQRRENRANRILAAERARAARAERLGATREKSTPTTEAKETNSTEEKTEVRE